MILDNWTNFIQRMPNIVLFLTANLVLAGIPLIKVSVKIGIYFSLINAIFKPL